MPGVPKCPTGPAFGGRAEDGRKLVRAPGLLPCLQPSIPCGIAAPDARLTGKSTNLPSWVLPISLAPTRQCMGAPRFPRQRRSS